MTAAPPKDPHSLDLSVTQVVASALASVSAAVAASFFGVAGTVVGAALGAVVATVGSAVYKRSIARTHARLKTIAPVQTVFLKPVRRRAAADEGLTEETAAGSTTGRPWARWATAAFVVFVLAIGTLTGVEALTGHPLSSLVTGKKTGGTSLGHLTPKAPARRHPTVSPPTHSPSPSTMPSSSTSPSARPSPTGVPSPSGVPVPSGTPVPTTPAAVVSPSPTP
jgi:hypothetical protein